MSVSIPNHSNCNKTSGNTNKLRRMPSLLRHTDVTFDVIDRFSESILSRLQQRDSLHRIHQFDFCFTRIILSGFALRLSGFYRCSVPINLRLKEIRSVCQWQATDPTCGFDSRLEPFDVHRVVADPKSASSLRTLPQLLSRCV